MGILVFTMFEIRFAQNRTKGYTLGQMVFDRDMIIPIKIYSGLGINKSEKSNEN